MRRYLARRLVALVPVLAGVSVVVFLVALFFASKLLPFIRRWIPTRNHLGTALDTGTVLVMPLLVWAAIRYEDAGFWRWLSVAPIAAIACLLGFVQMARPWKALRRRHG